MVKEWKIGLQTATGRGLERPHESDKTDQHCSETKHEYNDKRGDLPRSTDYVQTCPWQLVPRDGLNLKDYEQFQVCDRKNYSGQSWSKALLKVQNMPEWHTTEPHPPGEHSKHIDSRASKYRKKTDRANKTKWRKKNPQCVIVTYLLE